MTPIAIEQSIHRTIETLASESPQAKLENSSPTKSSAWQQKWISLDLVSEPVARMSNEAERFCARWYHNRPHPSMLVLSGPSGVGKTHTAKKIYQFARCAAFSAMEDGMWGFSVPSVLFVRWPEVADGFKEGNYGVIQDSLDASLLIIDDVGAEHDPSRNAADKLCQILSRREQMFTVITTNIEPMMWSEKFDMRIADRLLRNSVIVDINETKSHSVL
jgi:DNA replication protein DnaC